MLTLHSVAVSGFRGFTAPQTFNLDQPVVFLFGGNHCGKSSTLNAIEWCLFGEDCIGRSTDIRERVNWEVRNRDNPDYPVAVTVELADGTNVYRICRSQLGGGRRQRSTLKIALPDGAVPGEQDAERRLFQLCRSTFQDFMAATYQHQEAVRSIVTLEPRFRNAVIDRLFGLADYRDILLGINKANVADIAQEADRSVHELEELVQRMRQQREKDIEEKRAQASELGLSEADLADDAAIARSKRIAGSIESLARDLGLEASLSAPPSDWHGLSAFQQEARGQLTSLWAEAPPLKTQEELIQRQQAIDQARVRLEGATKQLAEAQMALTTFVEEHGDEAKLSCMEVNTVENISAIRAQIDEASSKANLLHEGIAYLQRVAPETRKSCCPLCGAVVPDLLSHLQDEWKQTIEERVQALQGRIDELQEVLDATNQAKAELDAKKREVERARAELGSRLCGLAECLGREIGAEDDPIALAHREIDQIGSQLRSIEETIRARRETLESIENELRLLSVVVEVLNLEEKRDFALQVTSTPEYQNLLRLRDQLASTEVDVREIRIAVQQRLAKEAASRIEEASKLINDHFCRMTQNPGISKLRLTVEPDSRTGGNRYEFLDQQGRDLLPIMNQGDLNCLALSIFLALGSTSAASEQLGFTMLDDPSQSLDTAYKRRLAEVVNECAQHKQIVLSTMDTELQEFLKQKITKAKAIYDFRDWSPTEGPRVERIA